MRPNRTARCTSLVMAIALALAFAQPSPAEYVVTDLLPLDAILSDAKAVNASGQVVGYAWGQYSDGSIYSCGFLWENGQSTNLFAQYPEIQGGSALDINDQGQVLGYCYTAAGVSAYIWQGGQLSLLDPLQGDNETDPVSINNAGQAIGYSVKPQEGDPYAYDYRPCLWQNGAATDLSAGGMEYVQAINEAGQVIGVTNAYAACLWQNGALTQLDPGGALSASQPTAINASGQVAGYGCVPGSSSMHAFVWLPQAACGLPAGLNDIGAQFDALLNPANDPGLAVSSRAWCISDAGQVFGEVAVSSYDAASGVETRSVQLWVWENGSITDMIPIPAYSMNKIAGTGSGLVAGSYMTAEWESCGFSWSRQSGLETVPCLEDGEYACLNDINEAGQVVGTCEAPVSVSGYTYTMSHAYMASKVATSVLPVSEATLVRHGRTCQVRVRITNPGTTAVNNVTISAISLGGGVPLTSLPLLFGTINPGASKQCTIQFKNIPAGEATLEIEGSCSLGNISSTQQVTAP
ncbi:hypothetical protein LLG95_05555 [bacterium]|nr:hypothetical protein [bacterium]